MNSCWDFCPFLGYKIKCYNSLLIKTHYLHLLISTAVFMFVFAAQFGRNFYILEIYLCI